MHKDQLIGSALLLASVIVIIVYMWLVFFPPIAGADIFILKLTGVVAVTAVFDPRMDRLHARNNSTAKTHRRDREGNREGA